MSRRRVLTDEQAEQLFQEYQSWLNNSPLKLARRYGIGRGTVVWYATRKHKSKRTIFDPLVKRKRAA